MLTAQESGYQQVVKVPVFFEELMEKLFQTTLAYLCGQVEAGVDVIQIFDSHAGLLEVVEFDRFVIKPTQRLVRELKKKYPTLFIISFPRGASEPAYERYARQTGVDCLSLDQNVSLDFAAQKVRHLVALQGNLNPETLLKGGAVMEKEAKSILERLGPRHIFNLGHGVLPETPPENIAALVSFVHSFRA